MRQVSFCVMKIRGKNEDVGGVCAEKAVSPFIGVFACLAAMFLCKKISFSKSVTFLFYIHDFCAPKDRFLPGFYPANVKIRASKP